MRRRGHPGGAVVTKQELTIPAPERRAYSFDQLVETGILWYINATAFHPHGLALAIENDPAGGWSIHATDNEPLCFPDDPVIHEKFRAVQAMFEQARVAGVVPDGGHPGFRTVAPA